MADKQYYHNKGEQDAADGKYNPPHGLVDEFTTWDERGMQKIVDENTAYKEGYSNTQNQKGK